jgi:hypothetical protein
LRASLRQYDVPFTGDAEVWAEVTMPDASTASLVLDKVADGVYSASFNASMPGVYPIRVRAEGYSGSDKFTREKYLTAATYYGDYGTTPPGDDMLCDLLRCLTSGKVLNKVGVERLRELGIDIGELKKCIENCPKPQERAPTTKPKPKPQPGEVRLAIRNEPVARRIRPPKPEPVEVPPMPKEFPRIIHMFDPISAKGQGMEMSKPGTKTFPRIVRRFSPPGEVGKTPPRSKKMARRSKRR